MGELVDVDSASLPTARTGGDAPQQSEIVSRDYCACSSKVETSTPRKTGPEARRGEMLGGHTRVCKTDDGEVENEGKNLSRKHVDKELSERRRAFARKKRREKRAERKAARMKHKAVRARSRLEEFTFGTFNVRTAAVNDVNDIHHIDTLLMPCAAKSCDVI